MSNSEKIAQGISIYQILVRLWRTLLKRRKIQFYFIFVFMILCSFSELISLGLVVPFLGVLLEPEKVIEMQFVGSLLSFFRIDSSQELIRFITLIFCSVVILSAVMRIGLLRMTTSFSYSCGTDLSTKLYRISLFQPYEVHVNRNSSEVISAVTKKVGIASQVLMQLLTAISSFLLLFFVSAGLFILSPVTAISATLVLGISYVIISFLTKRSLLRNSAIESLEQNKLVKVLQEGLGGIREVLLEGLQNLYAKKYELSDMPMRKAMGKNIFIASSPRFIMEAIGILLIVSLALYFNNTEEGIESYIPILGALALAAQRVLPAVQQGYSSWASITGSSRSLLDAIELLEEKIPYKTKASESATFSLKKSIKLNNLSFRHLNQKKWTLKDIDLEVTFGKSIAIVGPTGSGKSTLIDIIMGLLEPSKGEIFIDELRLNEKNMFAWRNCFAHVPQDIFILDASFSDNISFTSKESIITNQIKSAAKKANIHSVIDNKANKYLTKIGERGVQISGGQKQRVGIARALYKNTPILILDEATSALDNVTERKVMEKIATSSKDITIIMVAHRLSSIEHFDEIVFLDKGQIKAKGTFKELILKSKEFKSLTQNYSEEGKNYLEN